MMRMSREVHGSLSPPSRSPLRCLLLGVLLPISPSMAGAPVTPESAYNDAGYVSVNGGAHNLFYWMFESRSSPQTDPLILWLSGWVVWLSGCLVVKWLVETRRLLSRRAILFYSRQQLTQNRQRTICTFWVQKWS